MHLSSPKPEHTTGGSRRGARRGGEAGSGRTVRQQKCSPRKNSFLALFKASKKCRLNVSPEAQTSEILCKPVESKTRTYHRRFESERPTERSSEVGQDCVPKELSAHETKVHRSLQGIEEMSLQRLSQSTNMRNPM